MNIRVDHAQYQPTDRPIEDRFASARDENREVVGIFDGHGGAHTAEHLKVNLLRRILSGIPHSCPLDDVPGKMKALFESFDREIITSFTGDFKTTLRAPSASVRKWLIGKKLSEEQVLVRAHRVKSGSTALVAYLEGDDLILVNAGDCRAVMGTSVDLQHINWAQLTTDLNADNSDERMRIQLEHPGEEHVITGKRVLGQIGVTRSFGDAFYKLADPSYTGEVFGHPAMTPKGKMSMSDTHSPYYHLIQSAPYLTATPEVTLFKLHDDDLFLVLASDGLWNLEGVDNEWVINTIMRGWDEEQLNLAEYLMDRLKEVERPGDDVTIVVISFKYHKQDLRC